MQAVISKLYKLTFLVHTRLNTFIEALSKEITFFVIFTAKTFTTKFNLDFSNVSINNYYPVQTCLTVCRYLVFT